MSITQTVDGSKTIGDMLADVLHAQAVDVREAGRRELIEVAAQEGGWSPTRYRERIRAEGPSVGEFNDKGRPVAEGN